MTSFLFGYVQQTFLNGSRGVETWEQGYFYRKTTLTLMIYETIFASSVGTQGSISWRNTSRIFLHYNHTSAQMMKNQNLLNLSLLIFLGLELFSPVCDNPINLDEFFSQIPNRSCTLINTFMSIFYVRPAYCILLGFQLHFLSFLVNRIGLGCTKTVTWR